MKRFSKILLMIYLLMAFLTGFLSCVSGCYVEWFVIMALLAIPAIVTGTKMYRIIGAIACIIAISFAALDYRIRTQMDIQLEQKKIYLLPKIKNTIDIDEK